MVKPFCLREASRSAREREGCQVMLLCRCLWSVAEWRAGRWRYWNWVCWWGGGKDSSGWVWVLKCCEGHYREREKLQAGGGGGGGDGGVAG